MLDLQNLHFSYDQKLILNNLNLQLSTTAHVALVGESGCGKSTLLKVIYGLYDLDSGTISYNQNPVLGPAYHLVPGMDYMKYLAQDFDLMPFTTVAENVGKFLSNTYKDKKNARVRELLSLVGMLEYAEVKPKFLSGGQQQRVALARVLALEPKLLLLDEPFSQIDTFRRNALRRELFSYLSAEGIGCIFATHDREDILGFADLAVVMREGSILEVASPETLYRNPKDLYIAALFGEVNALNAAMFGAASQELLLYPHQLEANQDSIFKVTITANYFQGDTFLVEAIGQEQKVYFQSARAIEPGTQTGISIRKEK